MKKQAKQVSFEKPAIFWGSDPVGADESLMLVGGNFGKTPSVELCFLENTDPAPNNLSIEPDFSDVEWTAVEILQKSESCLKVVIPSDWIKGLYGCRISQKTGSSEEVIINKPTMWWLQGDLGLSKGSPGGDFRLFGKNLNFGGESKVVFQNVDSCDSSDYITLPIEKSSCYQLQAKLSESLTPGTYRVYVHNGMGGNCGWKDAGNFEIEKIRPKSKQIFNVMDYGAQPDTDKDCTVAIYLAMKKAEALKGGIVYFPRGRYRIDANMPEPHLPGPLKIPSGITLQGEAMELVSLYWPDRQEVLPSLIEGGDNFKVKDLTLYCQGVHNNVISGVSNATVARVRIRANCYYMLRGDNKSFHGRSLNNKGIFEMGAAIYFSGGHAVKVNDCDILHSNIGIQLDHVRGAEISNNHILYGGNHLVVYGSEGVVYEKNNCQGSHLFATGGVWSMYFEGIRGKNFYFAENKLKNIFGGDREAFTFDGHGTAYYGPIKKAIQTEVILDSLPRWGCDNKDMLADYIGTTLYIIDGSGVGQYREIVKCESSTITIDKPWDIDPDSSSTVVIGKFIGRLLFINNEVCDAGSIVQLYPPNCECIISGNKSYRGGNMNVGGQLCLQMPWDGIRVEPSWYNQLLDNYILEGNGWGGGESFVNGPLGGESYLNIYGYKVDSTIENTISQFHVVRRHSAMNNSSIRISGSVSDVLIEGCEISCNRVGICVEDKLEVGTENIDRVEITASPERILLRNNIFKEVHNCYVGKTLESIQIIDSQNMSENKTRQK